MLYVLECMILGFVKIGNETKMYTTGAEPSWQEVGVGFLGWVVLAIIVLLISFSVRYKKAQNVSFFYGIAHCVLYILECMTFCFLYLFKKREMRTTKRTPNKDDVAVCLVAWVFLILIIGAIILICIF